MPFVKPILDSLILQPYLIAVEEPQSVIPGNSKGVSWVQRIQDRSQRMGMGRGESSRSGKSGSGGGKSALSAGSWPYTQTQDGEGEGERYDLESVRK